MEGKKKTKLAIVGCSDSRIYAPFEDESWELWGVNNLFYHIKRWDKWFEIHQLTFDGKTYLRRGEKDFRGESVKDYLTHLGEMKTPIYMQKHWDEIPTSIAYPLNEVLEFFQTSYFTNTISWMIALGIYQEFEEIGIWGVDMAVDTEYHWQRPSCEYFIGYFDGLCKGKGLKTKLYMPPQCDLCKARYMYAFQETEQAEWTKKMRDMKLGMVDRQRKAEMKIREAEKEFHQYTGALQAQKEIDKIWK